MRSRLRRWSPRSSTTRRLRARARPPTRDRPVRALERRGRARPASPAAKSRAPSPSATHSRLPSMSLTTGSGPDAIASSRDTEVESERDAER